MKDRITGRNTKDKDKAWDMLLKLHKEIRSLIENNKLK